MDPLRARDCGRRPGLPGREQERPRGAPGNHRGRDPPCRRTVCRPIVYTSARTGTFVEDAFNALAIEIVDRAFRQDSARAVERGLRDKVLVLDRKSVV